MSAVSRAQEMRGHVSSWAVPGWGPRRTSTGWRWQRAFFACFLCGGGKESSAAPHRGEANRPIRMQGKANAVGKQPKPRRRRQTPPSGAQEKTKRPSGKKPRQPFRKPQPTGRNETAPAPRAKKGDFRPLQSAPHPQANSAQSRSSRPARRRQPKSR